MVPTLKGGPDTALRLRRSDSPGPLFRVGQIPNTSRSSAYFPPPRIARASAATHNILEKLALHTRLQIAAYARSGGPIGPVPPT